MKKVFLILLMTPIICIAEDPTICQGRIPSKIKKALI